MESNTVNTKNPKGILSNKNFFSNRKVNHDNCNPYNHFMITFSKGKTSQQNENVNKSKIQVNIDNKMITFNLKKEKDFFNSINNETNYNNFKKQMALFHKQSIPTPKNRLIKAMHSHNQRKVLRNIDISSINIKEEGNKYIQVEKLNTVNNDTKNMPINFFYKKAGTSDNLEFHNKSLPNFAPITQQINKCHTLSRTNTSKKNISNNASLEEAKNIEKDVLDTNENLIGHNSIIDNNYISNQLSQSQNKEYSSNKHNMNKSLLQQNQQRYIALDVLSQPVQQPKRMFFPNGFIICELCDLLIPKDLMINLNECNHSFCSRCAQNYYEDKIETGTDLNFNCPYYYCKTIIPETLLKKLVSAKLFKRYCRFQSKNLEHNRTFQVGSNHEVSFTNKDLSNYHFTLQEYNKKNVLDISLNDNSLYLYTQYKDNFCKDCNLPSLFGKNCKNILKCLNCFQRYCKFCLQKIDSADHFNVLNEDKCCKSYNKFYREQISSKKRKRYLNHLLQNVFCFFIGYWFLYIFILFYIDKYLNIMFCLKKKTSKTKHNVNKKSAIQIYKHNYNVEESIANKNDNCNGNKNCLKYFMYFRLVIKNIFLIISIFAIFICLLLIVPYFPMISTFYC